MSILEKLEKDFVVSFHIGHETNAIIVYELCDGYYFTDLTKEEALQLAREIEALANQLKDSK